MFSHHNMVSATLFSTNLHHKLTTEVARDRICDPIGDVVLCRPELVAPSLFAVPDQLLLLTALGIIGAKFPANEEHEQIRNDEVQKDVHLTILVGSKRPLTY